MNWPEIFGILPTASKGFFQKKQYTKKMYFFFYRACETRFLQSRFFALNLAYTGNWTHAQPNTSKIAIYIYLVLTFFLDHHILCLQLLVKIYPLSPFTYFLQIQTNHYNCISCYFFGKTNPLFAVSPLLCDWDFQPHVFPICCLKTNLQAHLFTPPRCGFCTAVTGLFFARTRGSRLLLVLGSHLGGMHGRNS